MVGVQSGDLVGEPGALDEVHDRCRRLECGAGRHALGLLVKQRAMRMLPVSWRAPAAVPRRMTPAVRMVIMVSTIRTNAVP